MRFVSFFAGIGGFDLGLERCGHECVAQVEIDPYALRVLERHWPDVPRFGDIRSLDPWSLPDADLWCGGFPCQPFSVAGKRAATEDERDLWPAWCRLIAVRRPRWIFGENVPGLLSAEGGAAWGRLVRDLAALGYVGEWTVLAARDVGAPHRRERLWVVAHLADAHRQQRSASRIGPHAGSDGRDDARGRGEDARGVVADAALERGNRGGRARVRRPESSNGGRPECWCGRGEPWCCDPADELVADAARDRRGRRARVGAESGGAGGEAGEASGVEYAAGDGRGEGRTESELRSGRDSAAGTSADADADSDSTHRVAIARGQRSAGIAQPRLGRVAHGIPRRVDRLRCLGNAVVPQVVEAIARRVWGGVE